MWLDLIVRTTEEKYLNITFSAGSLDLLEEVTSAYLVLSNEMCFVLSLQNMVLCNLVDERQFYFGEPIQETLDLVLEGCLIAFAVIVLT